MKSSDLETLLWVVRLGGISAAAERLHMTQPAITRRVQELERELQVKLFNRAGRLVEPTAAARSIVANAERVLSEIASLRVAANARASIGGTVRIGIAEIIGLTWFDRLLSRLAEDFPQLRVEMEIDVSDRLVERLGRRKIDLALLPGSSPVAGAAGVEIGSCAMCWAATPDLLRHGDSLSPHDLADVPLIIFPEGADWHGVVMRWFAEAGVRPRHLTTCNSLSVILALVRKGRGVSALPAWLVADDFTAGELVTSGETPTLPRATYTAAYLPTTDIPIMPKIVEYAREESWFR